MLPYVYAKNPDTGQLCRFRIKFNRIHSIKQRREVARNSLANYLDRWITSKGYSPDFKVNQFSQNMASDILEELRNNSIILKELV
ncbi:MAG TPA: hypothetical protein PK500_02595 [Candidatus Egerieousia sp.]|nr:hypothetical protein [Candidatus Egerieousia sp.]